MKCPGIPDIVRLEVESGFELVPKRYCRRHAEEQEWNSRLGFWGLLAVSLLPLWAGGFALTDRRVPSPVPMSLVFFLIAFGIIAWVLAMRYPGNPLFHRLRRKQARRFLREWTAARIRDDGPYVIANWGECMADGYLARLITETQTCQGSPQIMADALDRLRPGWFDSTYDSLLGVFVNQTSNTQELKAILDGHRPNWMKNNPVVRRAYANALANADITEFNRWHLLLRENDPEWLSQGLFQDFPESFRQIAMTLRQHASGATPDVLTVPERQGNYGDWPNIWYKDVHRVDYATDARSIWLKSLLWLAEQAVAHPGLPTLPIEDLRSLATLDHIGIRDKLGSYTEVYQSDPDSFSREETIVVRGLAWVQRCDSLQRLVNSRLSSAGLHLLP